MKPKWKYCILAFAFLLFGAIRLPFETALSSDLRKAGLFPPTLEIGTRERIGQTSSAVALGGLRTLVATFLNLRAFTAFTEQRWTEVEENFSIIVDLAPRTRYYWETGAWHQSYNAASYYINDSNLPVLRRRAAWRESILKGRSFLERGIRNNPDDWSIVAYHGALLTDSNKFAAFGDTNRTFSDAAESFQKSEATGKALPYVKRSRFYALGRVRGREAEALEIGRKLYDQDHKNRTPTLMSLMFALEAHENPDLDAVKRSSEIFGTAEKAYSSLSAYWIRTREKYPVYGVASALQGLEKILNIPAEKSILNKPLPPPGGPDEWFHE